MYPCLPGSPPITPLDPPWRTPWITRFMELPVVWGSLTPHLTLHPPGLRNPVVHPPLSCNKLGNYHNPLKFLRIMDRKWWVWYFVYKIVLTLNEKKIVLLIQKNLWNSRLKAENFQKMLYLQNNWIQQWNVRTIFESGCFLLLIPIFKSNNLDLLLFKLGKKIRNMQEKLEKLELLILRKIFWF